jgi:hypothetical protein
MVIFLRSLFGVVLLSMLVITSWASRHTSLFAIPVDVLRHPWFIATLFDAYWAFIAVFVWVAWKERSLAARILWFIAIVALGNISIAAYFLRELFRVRSGEAIDVVFTHRNPGTLTLPLTLTLASAVVYMVA